MPMGSASSGTGRCRPNAQFRLFITNIRYLNTPSSPRLNTHISATAGRVLRDWRWRASTHSPNSQFMNMENSITSTNAGSPQA